MRKVVPTALAIVLLTGCPPKQNPYGYSGTLMYELFPFDGLRTWEFISTDEDLVYSMIATMREQDPDAKEPKDGITRYTIDYTQNCRGASDDCVPGGPIRTITWSSHIEEGVRIHDYEDPIAGLIEYDPPIVIATAKMERDDVIETKSDGFTWTSTLGEVQDCPVQMNVEWPDCAHFTLDDGDGDDTTNPGLVGAYWSIAGFNVVTVQLVVDTRTVTDPNGEEIEVGQWQLVDHDCEPLEDCDGTW